MFHSAEIRWLVAGSLPPEIEDWFRQSDLMRTEEPRIDSYLPLPGCTTTSVKLREGRFEVKAQTSYPEPVHYENGLAGCRASWVKWSSDVAGADLTRSQSASETWVQLEKTRLLRVFAVGLNEPEESPPGENLDGPGCQLEASRLRVLTDSNDWNLAAEWWSMCLEAFGNQRDVSATLDKMAAHPSLARLSGVLPRDASMSYPDWLDRITQ